MDWCFIPKKNARIGDGRYVDPIAIYCLLLYIMATVIVMISLVMHAEKNHHIYNVGLPG